jgi:hypothetical protein
MDQEKDEDQRFIDDDKQKKYTQKIEDGKYSEIPTNWLVLFLRRFETNLAGYDKETGKKRPAVREKLVRQIGEIQAELQKREV